MSVAENPWQTPTEVAVVDTETQRVEIPAWGSIAGVSSAARETLPMQLTDYAPGIFLVGAHGGAGTSTLASLTGLQDAGHNWPVSGPVPNDVIVVARTNMTGLSAAHDAALALASGDITGVNFLGLVLMADAPGRLPKALSEKARLVSGAYRMTWTFPWIEKWRTGLENTKLPARGVRVIEQLELLHSERTSNHA